MGTVTAASATPASDPSASAGPSAFQAGHVGLNVTDLARSTTFYQRVLGLDVVRESQQEGRRFVFLARDGTLVLTLWQQAVDRFEAGRAGLHHLSFKVDGIEQVRAAEQTLRELGATFAYEGIVPHADGADSGGIFFEDPDGIRLEIFADSGAGEHDAPVADAPTCGFF